MGPPWVTGAGLLTVALFLIGLLYSPALLAAVLFFIVFLIGAAVALLGRSADSEGTVPDPVTGGRRWWQKRWDE
jgi:hypothetical protein